MNDNTAAQPLDLDKQRKLFEAGEHGSSTNLTRQADGQYEDPCTQSAWEGWQNALIAQARAAQPVQAGEAVDMDAERKRFEEYKEGRYAGTQHDVIGWYYFDEDVNDQWSAWQARATLASVAAQQERK